MYDDDRADPIAPVPAAQTEASGPFGVDIIGALKRYWFLIAILGPLFGVGAYLASSLITPRFTSTAQIYVDPRGLPVLDSDPAARQQDSNAAINFVESQMRIITSQSVLARVVDSERLIEDPEFGATTGGSPWAVTLLNSLGLRRTPAAETLETREQLALMALYDRVIVRRPERTFVIEVTARASTADKAAQIANAVAHAFMESQAAARSEAARRATQALTNRLDELRERVRVAEQRVEDFRRRNGLVGTRTQLVSEQQLTDANAALGLAQAKLTEAQARYDQIQQAARAGSQASALPEAIVSPTIATLRGQQADIRRRLADASAEFGPRHPSIRNLQAQVADVDRAIGEELGRIVRSARADLDRAKAADAAQRRLVDQLSAQAVSAGQAFVQLREMQREADVNRNLLNAFLSRSRETSELERMDTSNLRIITQAQPPRTRSFPPRGVVMAAAGFVAGVGAGAALAVLLGLLFPATLPQPAGRATVAGRPPVARLVY
ncbi:GumC family protein [Phreatobacter sp. AB_2022a]|uniref:GumC family protein n=1 Tax=Phreatobacter sp. AB_2022a TaxID=3003134 RepID=UPI0022876478|nr:GumC family protein [Phreatobacter sp. AB_2022a]MCZ0735163.1 GumC family protein [Phreatobacter sp. AB_2022a]